MNTYPTGQSVRLPSNRVGTVIAPAFLMPLHSLILFADGDRQWILTKLLAAR